MGELPLRRQARRTAAVLAFERTSRHRTQSGQRREADTWSGAKDLWTLLQRFQIAQRKANTNLETRGHSFTRCFSSQTRRAARRSALVRVRLPAAASGGSASRPLEWPAVLERGRPRRALGFRFPRAADSLTGR